jgi:hypothetical protein
LQHAPGAIRGGCRPHALRCASWAGPALACVLEGDAVSIVRQWCVRGARGARGGVLCVPPWLRCSRRLSLNLWRGCGGAGVQGCGCATHGIPAVAPRSIARPCKGNVIFLVHASSEHRDGAGTGCRMHEHPELDRAEFRTPVDYFCWNNSLMLCRFFSYS